MTIESYIKMRNSGKSLEDIQKEEYLSEGTVYTLELGYQCYLKKLPLDQAIDIVQRVYVFNPAGKEMELVKKE